MGGRKFCVAYCQSKDNNVETSYSLPDMLRNWAVTNNITHTALNSLFKILKSECHSNLPKDSRTLLSTQNKTE